MLGIVAAGLLVADGFWAYARYLRPNAALTYVGLDSVVMTVPASAHAAQLRDGKWDSDPFQALRSRFFDPPPGEKAKPMVLVSLSPDARFGQAVAVFRDLKARRICHVIIRESGTVTPVKVDFGRGREAALDVPAITLCGNSYGDAGFAGQLPGDRLVHIGVEEQVPTGS